MYICIYNTCMQIFLQAVFMLHKDQVYFSYQD